MADFIAFNEGRNEVGSNGLPATCYFFLSTKGVDAGTAHTAGETLAAADLGEITGTGAARKSQAEPTPASGVYSFAQMSWATAAATDWPAGVRSIVLATGPAASGKAICAWNLQVGGAARDMSAANTTENVTPTLNVGG
jgi:hypothetical protein